MADTPSTVKGMNDIAPPDVAKWQFVEERARMVLDAFSYRELRTPLLEYTNLFLRGVGETTDVVEKQMYTFDDRDGRSVSLRPEGTASAVRAYIAQAQWHKEPVTKWFYMGPMFRHERAQRGRLRQFHQIGAEVIGLPGPGIDAEVVAMLVALLTEVGLPQQSLQVVVNTLGEPDERAAYRDALQAYFRQFEAQLDEDSRRRLQTNPLRILDSKEEATQKLCEQAPLLFDHLGQASKDSFTRFTKLLGDLGVTAVHDPRLVRGLDYYTGVIFEIKATIGDLGAQNTLAGGGRYDHLIETLGGPKTPALGFGMGVERVLLAIPDPPESFEAPVSLFIAPLGEKAYEWALPMAHKLRLRGIRVEVEHRPTGLKNQLKRANKMKARLALIVGDNELESGKLALKDLATEKQHEVDVGAIEAKIQQLLD
ncbi:MAG: histidine--tRNA ligase [Deltaproteobacteria bacterium]|nr:histidine--tRNA ligase [Deltaproteobacteria bacterium]